MTTKKFIETIIGVHDPNVVETLAKAAHYEVVPKGSTVVNVDELQKDLMFLVQGVLRGCLVDSKGREYTDCFVTTCGEPILGALAVGDTSKMRVEVLKPSEVLCFPMSVVQMLLQESLEINHLYIKLLSGAMQKHWEMKRILYLYSAEEKYLWFLKHYPELPNQVQQKHIATYLNMTPETLSEVKRKLKQRGFQPN